MITTVIPTFIRDDSDLFRLKRAIDSVLAQLVLPDSILVSDDTKDESMVEKIHALISNHSARIKYVAHQQASNASRNTNFAVSNVRSELIHILHQDDWITFVGFYSEVINALMINNESWALAKGVTSEKINEPAFSQALVFGFNSIGGPSALVIRKRDWIPLDGDFLLLPDVIQFSQLKEKFGEPYITSSTCIEYGTGAHKMTNRISQNEIMNDIERLFSKGIAKTFPSNLFLSNRKYWGIYLELISLCIMKNQSLDYSTRVQALATRTVSKGYSATIKLKSITSFVVSKSHKRSHP